MRDQARSAGGGTSAWQKRCADPVASYSACPTPARNLHLPANIPDLLAYPTPQPCPVWTASAMCFPRYLDAGYEATSQHLPHTSHTTHLDCVCHVLFQAPRQLVVQQLPCPTAPTHPQGTPCPPLPPTWIESAGFQHLPHISHTVALPSLLPTWIASAMYFSRYRDSSLCGSSLASSIDCGRTCKQAERQAGMCSIGSSARCSAFFHRHLLPLLRFKPFPHTTPANAHPDATPPYSTIAGHF